MSQETAAAVFLYARSLRPVVEVRSGQGVLDARRFAVVFAAAFVVIAVGQLLKGHAGGYAATQALVWAVVFASIFITARLYHPRKGRHCALCRDAPEMPG